MDVQVSQPADAGNAGPDTGALDPLQAMAALLEPAQAEPEKKAEPATEAEKPAEVEGAEVETDKPAEKMFTVQVDGKDVEISESELVNGYKAQKASTQKFEAASALRKEADAEVHKARQERQQYAQGLHQAQTLLGAALQEHQKTDWHALRESHPEEFLKQWHLFTERQAAFQQNHQAQQQLHQVEQADRTRSYADHLQTQEQALVAKIPDWKDPAKASADKGKIAAFLTKELGFEPVEITGQLDQQGNLVRPGLADHRVLIMAREAMLYREMMAKAKAAAAKVQNIPQKTVVPDQSSVSIDKRGAQFQQLRKTGSVRDAVSLMSNFV